jgi:hypothetical protein
MPLNLIRVLKHSISLFTIGNRNDILKRQFRLGM